MVGLKEYIVESQMITESVVNLFDTDKKDKEKYKDQVWDIMQKSYEKQGGLHGSGFKNPDDMVQNIPFWKLDVVDGEVLCVVMYKFSENKSGVEMRKCVGFGRLYDEDRKALISKKFINIIKHDLDRSIMEISDNVIEFLRKIYGPQLDKYKFTVDQVKQILKKDDIVKVDDYKYERKIGGNIKHEKLLIGTIKGKF